MYNDLRSKAVNGGFLSKRQVKILTDIQKKKNKDKDKTTVLNENKHR
jgi:hypothetical protein